MKQFSDFGIKNVPADAPEIYRTTCPECSEDRKKSRVKCLTVWTREGTWSCAHCGWGKGLSLHSASSLEERRARWQSVQPKLKRADEAMYDWFWRYRKIPKHIVERNKITAGDKPFKDGGVIAFNYFADGVLVNVKYRTDEVDGEKKRMWQTTGGTQVLYKLDDLLDVDECIITEGEIDALSYEEAGYQNAVSLPVGAIGENDTNFDARLGCLETCSDTLRRMRTIYLAMDADGKGRRTRDELARRLQKRRCMIVEYPEDCKDANDVLVKYGAERLARTIAQAKPYPVEIIVTPDQLTDLLVAKRERGVMRSGNKIGIEDLDNLISWKTPQLTVVTGIPNHGKSPFVDQLMMSLSVRYGWKWGIASLEHDPDEHEQRLVEQLVGKPYSQDYQGAMSLDELMVADSFLREHVRFMDPGEEEFKPELFLEYADYLVQRHGCNGFLLDPWNDIESTKSPKETTHDWIGRTLRKLFRWTKSRETHLFIVAHPTKMPRDKKGNITVPGAYNIAESSHFNNRPDNILSVYRQRENGLDMHTEIHVLKVRHKHVGKTGTAKLTFDVGCQRFNRFGPLYGCDRSNWLERMWDEETPAPVYEPDYPTPLKEDAF